MKLSDYILLQYAGWRGLMLGAFTAAIKNNALDQHYSTEEIRMAGSLLVQAIHGVNMRKIDEKGGNDAASNKLRQEARARLVGLCRVMDTSVADCRKRLYDIAGSATKRGEFNRTTVASDLLFNLAPRLDEADDIAAVRKAAEAYEEALLKLCGEVA